MNTAILRVNNTTSSRRASLRAVSFSCNYLFVVDYIKPSSLMLRYAVSVMMT